MTRPSRATDQQTPPWAASQKDFRKKSTPCFAASRNRAFAGKALAKRENMTNEEAGLALNKVEADFWASKAGQKLIRDRVDRTFPEFIARVPAGVLADVGLKRHYKLPEALKILRAAKT